MGGGGGGQTSTSMPVIPAEFKPLVNASVQQLLGLQQALPITMFASFMPRPIAPMSPFYQEFMNLVPLMQVPTAGIQTVFGQTGPAIQSRVQQVTNAGSADRQMQLAQQLADRGPVYQRPEST